MLRINPLVGPLLGVLTRAHEDLSSIILQINSKIQVVFVYNIYFSIDRQLLFVVQLHNEFEHLLDVVCRLLTML